MPKPKDGGDSDAVPVSGRSPISKAIVVRSQANGIIVDEGVRSVANIERNEPSGGTIGSNWAISSFFRRREAYTPSREMSSSDSKGESIYHTEHALSIIHLRKPPTTLSSSEVHSEQEAIGIAVTKQLLGSYYAIGRKNIEDSVPKAIMHFLVNCTKRGLRNVLIGTLYRESLLGELLQENEEVAMKRVHAQETLRALQQASWTLDELPIEAKTI